jgi:methylenetetrahydrofolate reductase (NADPH)
VTAVPPNRLRARLHERTWAITVEVVTPALGDAATIARILELARVAAHDERLAALTLTDRTTSAETTDPVDLARAIADASGAMPLVHIAGKGRTLDGVTAMLARLRDAGINSVLLTGGDPLPGVRERCGAITMIASAARVLADPLIVGVVAPSAGRPLDEAYADASEKQAASIVPDSAGALAFIAQVTWDAAQRAAIAGWQARLRVPILGAVMLLTRGRLQFLAANRIAGIRVPPGLRRRAEQEDLDGARERLALDVLALERLGYAGVHVTGLLTPARVVALLDDVERLDATLGEDWQPDA